MAVDNDNTTISRAFSQLMTIFGRMKIVAAWRG